MKKFYFIIICLFSFVLPVLAAPTTYERNENNHYGVNKKWSIKSTYQPRKWFSRYSGSIKSCRIPQWSCFNWDRYVYMILLIY